MGFAPEVWYVEALGDGLPRGLAEGSRDVAGRVEHLFDVVRNPRTGEPYTNAEVARMSAGDLTAEELEDIRRGKITDPTVG